MKDDANELVPCPDLSARFLERLRLSGSVVKACEGLPITRTRLYELRRADEAFAAAWDQAKDDAIDLLEDEAKRRAMGYQTNVWHQGEVVGQDVRYSDGLLQFVLKGNRARYRDKVDHELQGVGVTLVIQTTRELPADLRPAIEGELAKDDLDLLG